MQHFAKYSIHFTARKKTSLKVTNFTKINMRRRISTGPAEPAVLQVYKV